ncbi:MAG: hypothetical protein DRP85_07485 [Candidatus Makaraimicrobium thalassicum]|nr:MAG: hypothetical protein DRP85_07485 [Candidatus Omnitrophota bacterium]
MKKTVIVCFAFSVLSVFLPEICAADVITLKGGARYEGRIIDVDEGHLLLEERAGLIWSFSSSHISTIELKPFEPSEASSLNFPVTFFAKFLAEINAFDRLVLEKGAGFLGIVEKETTEAVYLSLLLEKMGIGIVEFEREGIVGIEGSYGIKRLLAKLYFKWRYFVNDFRLFMKKTVLRENLSTVDGAPIHEFMKELELKELKDSIGGRRVFTPRTLKKFLGPDRSLRGNRHEKGVEERCLFLGMDRGDVKSILGDPPRVSGKRAEESWSYPTGLTAIFHGDRLIGYTKKNREKILGGIDRYFRDKIAGGPAVLR